MPVITQVNAALMWNTCVPQTSQSEFNRVVDGGKQGSCKLSSDLHANTHMLCHVMSSPPDKCIHKCKTQFQIMPFYLSHSFIMQKKTPIFSTKGILSLFLGFVGHQLVTERGAEAAKKVQMAMSVTERTGSQLQRDRSFHCSRSKVYNKGS